MASGIPPNQPTAPVTIIKNPIATAAATSLNDNAIGTESPVLSTSSNGSLPAASAAMQAIKRHALDFVNPKELMVLFVILGKYFFNTCFLG